MPFAFLNIIPIRPNFSTVTRLMADSQLIDKTPHQYSLGKELHFNATEIFAQAKTSIVTIPATGGTGFFVTSDKPHSCEIATTQHVANEALTTVTTRDGKTYQARAELLDDVHELSVYKLDGVKNPRIICRELTLSSAKPYADQPVLVIGAAGAGTASAQHPEFHIGAVTGRTTRADSFERMTHEPGYYWLRAVLDQNPPLPSLHSPMVTSTPKAKPGYSGGPWLNGAGQVFAIEYGAAESQQDAGDLARFLQEDLAKIKGLHAKAGGGRHNSRQIEGSLRHKSKSVTERPD